MSTGRYPAASTPATQDGYCHSLRIFRKAARDLASVCDFRPVTRRWPGKEGCQRNGGILCGHGFATFIAGMPGAGENPLRHMDPQAEHSFSAAMGHWLRASSAGLISRGKKALFAGCIVC